MTHAIANRMPHWALAMIAPLVMGATPPPHPNLGPTPAETQSTVSPDIPAEGDMTASVATPAIQPFDLDATRRMSVPVSIGGQGPFSFLVDTGAERTVIARELATRLGLADGSKLRLATIGSALTVPSFHVASLEMTNLRMNPFEAPAFAGRHIGAAGLIGVDMLADRRILIDFRKETLSIFESQRRARPLIRDDDAIVVTARNMSGRLILSQARIDGMRVNIIVDTGAQTSIGNMALKQMVKKHRQNSSAFFPTELTSVTGEAVAAEGTAIRRIVVGGITMTNLAVSFADSQAFRALDLDDRPALLLGMDSLHLFDRVEIDFPNRRIVFDMPSGAARDTHNRLAEAIIPLPS
jgi:predicted aspartyl protease